MWSRKRTERDYLCAFIARMVPARAICIRLYVDDRAVYARTLVGPSVQSVQTKVCRQSACGYSGHIGPSDFVAPVGSPGAHWPTTSQPHQGPRVPPRRQRVGAASATQRVAIDFQ